MLDNDNQVSKEEAKLNEVVLTMEYALLKNKELHDKMLTIMKEKEGHEEKLVQSIREIKDILRIQSPKVEKFDGNAEVASYNVANIARNVFDGFVNRLLKMTGFKHALGFFGRATRPINLGGVRYDGDYSKVSEGVNLVRCKKGVIDGDNDRISTEGEDVNKVLDDTIENTKEKEHVLLDVSYMGRESGTNLDDKKGGVKTTSDSENLARHCSSNTNLKTMIIIEDTEHLDDKVEMPSRDSSKTNLNHNRLLIEPSDSFGDNINKDLTGYNIKDVETSTPLNVTGINEKLAKVFVFSDDKKSETADTADDIADQSLLSLMTFEGKKVYFAQKIKDKEKLPLNGSNARFKVNELKSPEPSVLIASSKSSPTPLNPLGFKSKGEATKLNQNDLFVSPFPAGGRKNVTDSSINISSTNASTTLIVGQPAIPFAKNPEGEQIEDGDSESQKELLLSTIRTL